MAGTRDLTETYEARRAYLMQLGDVSPDVIAPLVNPSFMGGPTWPDLRQAWQIIRRGKNTIFVSDGLSDPFSEQVEPNTGFGLEVLVESEDELPQPHQATWLFNLVYGVSQQCADHGGVRGLVEQLGTVSLELPNDDENHPAKTENNRVGVLLGVTPPDFPSEFTLPGGNVKIVTAKLLWQSELQYAAENGTPGRNELVELFKRDETHHRSSLKRSPVIGDAKPKSKDKPWWKKW